MCVKQLVNLPILCLNQELISIMVNKGQIHAEIREYFMYSLNSFKLDNKLGILVNLERKLLNESLESKIARFGSVFAKKSRSKIKKEKLIVKREKIVKFNKSTI